MSFLGRITPYGERSGVEFRLCMILPGAGSREISVFRFPLSRLNPPVIWKLPARDIISPRRALVIGIVNVNDVSFSGDGTLEIDAALDLAARQIGEGADVIDVGAESA